MKLMRPLIISLIAAATAMAGVSPSLLNLVMPDATILSGANVDQSIASPFGQYILSQMQPNDSEFLQFISQTGFDPRKDLHEILVATNATSSSTSHTGLILGRGVFQPAMIIGAATGHGDVVTTYKGISVITPPAGSTEDHAVAFLDASTAAIGDLASVKGVIDRKIAGATFSGSLATQAVSVSANNSAWFVTLTPLANFLNGKQGGNINGITQTGLVQSVQQASGGVLFGSTSVTATSDAVADSPQNAQSLADVVKFLLSMLAGNTNAPSNVQSIATAVQLSVNGSTVHLSLTLPEQQIEQLLMPQSEHKSKTKVAVAK